MTNMNKKIKEIESAESFAERLKEVKKKVGKELLTDDDLFIMICEKIFHTYTFEEKGYK